jgi:hypothetical protein
MEHGKQIKISNSVKTKYIILMYLWNSDSVEESTAESLLATSTTLSPPSGAI